MFINLVYLFKEAAPVFIEFFSIAFVFLWSFLFPLLSLLFSSFCWIRVSFSLLFLILLDGSLGHLFEIFLCPLFSSFYPCFLGIFLLSEMTLSFLYNNKSLTVFLDNYMTLEFPSFIFHLYVQYFGASLVAQW